jgi:hypothetical protein
MPVLDRAGPRIINIHVDESTTRAQVNQAGNLIADFATAKSS